MSGIGLETQRQNHVCITLFNTEYIYSKSLFALYLAFHLPVQQDCTFLDGTIILSGYLINTCKINICLKVSLEKN